MPCWYYWCQQSDSIDLDHALKARRWVVSPHNEIELLTFALGG